MGNTYHFISEKLAALGIDIYHYEDVVRCYILARLNIQHSSHPEYDDGIYSEEFQKAVSLYQLDISDRESDYHSPAFFSLCGSLAEVGLDKDDRLFFETFTPFLVADWDRLESFFPKERRERLVYVLYLILKSTKKSGLSFADIDTATIEGFYNSNQAPCKALEISKDVFIGCWLAVYHIPMPNLKGTVSPSLVDAIRFYRKHKVSGLQLVKHYCEYNKYKTQLEDAFNPWLEFEQAVKGKINTKEGISIAESAFNMVESIQREKPSDVIRAALYPFPALFGRRSDLRVRSNYDGKFECSFFLQQFEGLARKASQVLIVNPGPDFLLAWSQKSKQYACKCCVAVPNIYVATAYRMEFKNFRFCIFSDLEGMSKTFDMIAIPSMPSTEEFNVGTVLSTGKDNAGFIALLPQTAISAPKENICATLQVHNFFPDKIIAIAPQATVSKPGKKMLLFASNCTDANAPIPIFFTQCDQAAANLIVEKEYIHVRRQELSKPTTLVKLRNAFEKAKIDPDRIKHRKRPSSYQFSKEITLLYTTHWDKYGVFVGEAYYRGIAAPENTANGQAWNSPTTQKGLRCKDQADLVSRMESVPYTDTIYPYIVGDMLDHYGENIAQCSLKTVWFCCRSRLLARRNYDDEIARTVLFGSEKKALSDLTPTRATDEDYRKAMQAVIPEESVAVVKYWQQLNIIMRAAAQNGFIPINPIPALLSEVSNRASKELRNLRNMLTKKTLTVEEESRILAYVREESGMAFGPRKALRFEVDGTLLLGPIHLFTGMSTREACALTWGDFEQISGLDACHLLVYKFLSDDGTFTYQSDGKANRYAYRKIPVAPLLAEMLNSRKTYLKAVCGFTEAELQHMPIITANNRKSIATLSKPTFCEYDTAVRICRMLVEKADIPTQELVLPGSGAEELVVDMNKYQGDIFYSNFKHKANHTCAFNRGELSYVIGNKAPDTFSQHYCDYTNDLVQYAMVQKLNRWTHMHETRYHSTVQSIAEVSTFTRDTVVHSNRKKNQYNAISITISAPQEVLGSRIDIAIECDHGVSGNIAVYDAGGKECD
jgi:integrase